jgi:hypothetical protein
MHAAFLISSSPTLAGLPPADNPSYTLKFELAPSVIGKAELISATLDIDRFVDGRFLRRMTYPLTFDATAGPLRTTGVLRTTGGFGDGESLRNCRAQINFVVRKDDGKLMSVQNPVAIDPDLFRPDARAGGTSSPAGILNGPGR